MSSHENLAIKTIAEFGVFVNAAFLLSLKDLPIENALGR